jgi:hypothetical protein
MIYRGIGNFVVQYPKLFFFNRKSVNVAFCDTYKLNKYKFETLIRNLYKINITKHKALGRGRHFLKKKYLTADNRPN